LSFYRVLARIGLNFVLISAYITSDYSKTTCFSWD
jgi:hypothetical protein